MICHLELIFENHAPVRNRCGERYRVQLQFDLIDVDLWQLLARSDPNQLGFVGVILSLFDCIIIIIKNIIIQLEYKMHKKKNNALKI